MSKTVRAAAIYARISSDQDGTSLGVQRQLEDCRRLAEQLGWPVGDEYVDNDLSAYSGKRRPEYERMLTDLADGSRDAVLVYHVDRLTRRPIELEQFLQVLEASKVRQVRFVAGGELDLGSGDGLMVLRMLLAVAANESATKSRRVKRKMQQNAELGLPHGGYRRPFGFDDDKVTIRPDEAQVIRDLAARFLAGESLRSLAVWLDEQGIPTVAGKPWRTPTLRAPALGPDRRAARAPGRGDRPRRVGTDHHRANPSADPGTHDGAGDLGPSLAPAIPAFGAAALQQVQRHAVQLTPGAHPPVRVPVRS